MKPLMLLSAALAATALPLPAAAANDPVAAEQTSPTRFSVEVVGKGPDVIMIPGLSSPHSVWDDTVAAFSDRYRFHVVEVAGFGDTPAGPNAEGDVLPNLVKELAIYIDTNGLDSPAVVGHSMGGFTGLTLALDHADKVGKLLIVDSLPFFPVIMNPAATVDTARPQAEQLRAMMTGSAGFEMPEPNCDAPSMQAQSMSNDPESQCLIDRYTYEADRAVSAQLMYEIMTTDLRPRLGELTVPTGMLYPVDPPAIPAELAEALYTAQYEAATTVRLSPVEGARHFIMFDQPETFRTILGDFLAT